MNLYFTTKNIHICFASLYLKNLLHGNMFVYLDTKNILRTEIIKFFHYFFRYLKIKLGRKYCLQIPINVVKKGIRMYHPFNIIVNVKSIGENCVLHFDTCLIAGGNSKDTPTIGDNVIIGAKSVIIGGVTIANGVAIGANSTVTKSFFEENITIAGSPARKISDKGSSSW